MSALYNEYSCLIKKSVCDLQFVKYQRGANSQKFIAPNFHFPESWGHPSVYENVKPNKKGNSIVD